jgi:Spy/CpxP family protein refolding chaperone
MRIWWITAIAVVVAMCLATTVLAQPPGGQRPGGPPGLGFGFGFGGGLGELLGLLRNEQVQKEVGITAEQRSKLEEAGRQLMEQGREQFRQQFQGMRDLSPEERRQRFAQLMDESRARVEEVLKPVLTAEQMARLRQIELQVAMQGPRGVRTLLRKDVASALGLTEEQVKQIEALADRINEQMREAFQPGAGPEQREQMRAKMEQLRTQARAEVEKILTQEQLGKLKELLGAPFRMEMPGPPGFRRGEGGPGPGGAPPGGERPGRGRRGTGGQGGGRA